MYYREEKSVLYGLGFFSMLISYYTIGVVDIDEKFLNKISIFISISSVVTIIFNGMLNLNLTQGVAFSGRINPFMYIPYIIVCINNYKKNELFKNIFIIILILNAIDILWTDSRATILSMFFIIIVYYYTMNVIKDKCKINKFLKVLCIVLLCIRIFIPIGYIWLYENYADKLNEISYKYTKKHFFSGRQQLWNSIYSTIKGKEMIGTGDVNYQNQSLAAHNEFLNLYYCWGLPVAIMSNVLIYIIARKGINKVRDDRDIVLIVCFLSNIICTIFETYIYTIHFFIFNVIPLSYIINRKGENNEKISKNNI